MFSAISSWLLKLFGWKITGRYPREIPKMVMAVAPHTSNWDFPIGLLVRSALKMDAQYVGKHTLFKPPFGWIFYSLGGIPVDRTRRTNFVEAVVDSFKEREHVHLVMAPEGTRSKVDKFKTGFYHIARLAQVPILLISFDWSTHDIHFGELFHPTGDEEKDMAYLWNYFAGFKGKNPELGVG